MKYIHALLYKHRINKYCDNVRLYSYQFSFGLIADVQYADSEDSMNFQGTRLRRYRQSLETFREATLDWNSKGIKEAIVLGDMIDGKCATEGNQHECLNKILGICSDSASIERFHFCFGNHCHYNFNRYELRENFIKKYISLSNEAPLELHYEWTPHPNWRFIFLDSYDVSLIGNSTEANRLLAEQLLAEHNPNNLSISGTWFNNLPREKRRWVPYNGMISDNQLVWLKGVLKETCELKQKVIIFSHQPVYSQNPSSLVWNSEEILKILHESGNICAWIAGHDHGGQYNIDSTGIHHLVPPAPIETAENEVAYGSIDVYKSQLILNWKGKLPEFSPVPWPKELQIIS